MNMITLTGNIGRSEMKELNDGTKVLKFTLAVDKNFKRGKKDIVYWFNCSVFGTYGQAMSKFAVKGSRVMVTGEMQIPYSEKNEKIYQNVNVTSLEMIRYVNDDEVESLANELMKDNDEDYVATSEDDDNIPF